MSKPVIRVACAIIRHQGRVLAARRAAFTRNPLKWEFPGGKLEPGEDEGNCIEREILEELGLKVMAAAVYVSFFHENENRILELIPVECWPDEAHLQHLNLMLTEHDEARFFSKAELTRLDWTEPDIPVMQMVAASMS